MIRAPDRTTEGCATTDPLEVSAKGDIALIKVEPIQLQHGMAVGVMVELPQTRQLTISTTKGYISAGYIDLPFLQQRRPERNIIAARVLDVREIRDLLAARVFDCTPAAAALGVTPGMTGEAALELMF